MTMWALQNGTPYAAERSWVLDKDASKIWVVVVKGTYDILPDGMTELAEEQNEPLYVPEYSGEPGTSSLTYEADLTFPKSITDIVVNGHAYARGGKPVRKVTVAMAVEKITKKLLVFGDRRWDKGITGLVMTPPEPFETKPITYERAFGGWDTNAEDPAEHRLDPRNPIGAGFATRSDHLAGESLPNVEYENQLISSWKDRPRPAGFGPLASYWSPRMELAGTYDAQWQKERFPLLPNDFDERYYQVAPVDQQAPGFLRGGEQVNLVNLSVSGSMSFRLPSVHLGFRTRFGRDWVGHRANLHTVILEPDWPRVIMVWHTSLPCHHQVDALDMTYIYEKRSV